MEKLSNPQKTIEIIKKYEFAFQKKFGQNFLIVPGGGGQRSGGGGNRPDADPHS